MDKKYTNAKYPDKINDLVDNDGNVTIGGEPVPSTGDVETMISDALVDVQDMIDQAINGLLEEEF